MRVVWDPFCVMTMGPVFSFFSLVFFSSVGSFFSGFVMAMVDVDWKSWSTDAPTDPNRCISSLMVLCDVNIPCFQKNTPKEIVRMMKNGRMSFEREIFLWMERRSEESFCLRGYIFERELFSFSISWKWVFDFFVEV